MSEGVVQMGDVWPKSLISKSRIPGVSMEDCTCVSTMMYAEGVT